MKAKTVETLSIRKKGVKPLLLSKERSLTRITLLHKIYRVLLNSGRSYAAFTEKERGLIESLSKEKEIFDPMSGYGSLTRYCAERGLKSYCVEYNLPQYLWQVLCHPAHASNYIKSCKAILSRLSHWPRASVRAVASDEWFPEESQRILLELLELTRKSVKRSFGSPPNLVELSLALLMPFVGRLSCSVPGDIVTHTKKGGMCVYRGWEDDYNLYLLALIQNLEVIIEKSITINHTIVHGDARTVKLPKNRFAGLITSPPYPAIMLAIDGVAGKATGGPRNFLRDLRVTAFDYFWYSNTLIQLIVVVGWAASLAVTGLQLKQEYTKNAADVPSPSGK